MYVDLHTHSTASDGTNTPTELATLAKRAGLVAFALTDHDTTAGLPECEAACREHGVTFVPGIEVSADAHAPFITTGLRLASPSIANHKSQIANPLGTLHILGLFVRHDDPELARVETEMKQARDERNPAIVARLRALGVNITYDQVQTLARDQGSAIIGRPHIGQVMIDKGYVKSMQDAFGRYIGQGAPAYVRRDRLDPARAIAAIHHAGGLAAMAHPVQLRLTDPAALEHVVARLKDVGLDAIEARHSDHAPNDVTRFDRLADKLGLLTTGGSDYHGSRKSVQLGGQRVPAAVYERLREKVSGEV